MKILSIDVGIKHLAFCLFDILPGETKETEQTIKILIWDIINLCEETPYVCSFVDKEKNQVCDKPAKFQKNNKCYCLKHSKKQEYNIPKNEQKMTYINKQKMDKLYEISKHHNIQHEQKIKKSDLLHLINEHIHQHYFEPLETAKAADINLFQIGKIMKSKFDKMFETQIKIDTVIIENQISPIATRMKTVQGMIVQYFVMSTFEVDHIEFISAANKLKVLPDPATTHNVININKQLKESKDKKATASDSYSNRKKQGITNCLEIITTNQGFNEHIDYFNHHKKKDDLADSFLQGIWYIRNKCK